MSKTCHYCKENTHHIILYENENERMVQCEKCSKRTLETKKVK
jgi:transposase